MLKLYSWNVNGIRAAQRKGFLDWLHDAQPDILGIQETKAMPEQLDGELRAPAGYHCCWASAERKGYSGTALFSRREPQSVQSGIGIGEFDCEGRTIVADYGSFVFLTAYFPNGGADHSRVPFKMRYCAEFLRFCNALRAQGRRVIFCGDINTAHRPIDLARPKQNERKTGFLPEERAWLDRLQEAGYVDIWRARNPRQEGAYTWWTMRSGARARNVGWRLDSFWISPDLCDDVRAAEIHPEVMGSDHCPVSLTLAL